MNTATKTEVHLAVEPLLEWMAGVLAAAGMREAEAAVAAGVLLRTSLRGIDTHGISRLPNYVDAMMHGRIKARPDHGAAIRNGMMHYDGDGGLGQLVGVRAVEAAVEQARTQAAVTCLVHDCGHLAALGSYVLLAAEAGMIGVMAQATQPLMALPGWTSRAIGNNPLAFATPIADRPPLVFDMAASVVARGHLRQAIREGTPIAEGWAIAPDGTPTTDPEAAWNGAVLPTGGYKGMGIAMLVQTLCNSLLANSPEVAAGTTARMGAFLMVINPALVESGFGGDIDSWLGTYLAAGGDNARYPGERAAVVEAERSVAGIPAPPVLLEQLRETGVLTGVPFGAQPV